MMSVQCRRRRIRGVGDAEIPLNETVPKCVTFIVAERDLDAGGIAKKPIGTGFIVEFTQEGVEFRYIVTAAHCVQAEDKTWVRIPISETETDDFIVHDWVFHPTEDIAVTPFDQTSGPWRSWPMRAAADNWDRPPSLGDRVYFLGLMRGVPEMENRNIPIVRSGTIAALYQDKVPVKRAPDLTVEYRAHLIDTRSYAGFSGSPCFIQFEEWRTKDIPGGKVLAPGSTTLLFGLVMAHIEIPGEEGDRSNSGVAVVVPVEKIKETLDMEELAEDRKDSVEAYKKKRAEDGAVLDSIGDKAFSAKKFQDALRTVSRRVKPSEPD